MKRFLFVSVCFLLLVGCNSKSSDTGKILSCESSNTVGSALSEQSYKVYFNDDKVENLSININIFLNEQDDITRDNLESDVSKAFDSYKNRDGVSYSSNIKDNGFTVKLDIYFNKLSDEDKASISIIDSQKSYDEIKSEFESDGFICK